LAAAVLLGAGLWWYFCQPMPLAEIRKLVARGQWDEANDAITKYLAKMPADNEALMLAARIAQAKDELERCVSLLGRVSGSLQLRCQAALARGQVLRQMGYGQRAEQALRQAAELADQLGDRGVGYGVLARSELVSLLHLENRLDEALELLRQMPTPELDRWRSLIIKTSMLVKPDVRSDSAIEKLQQCIRLDESDMAARRALIYYLLEAGNLAQAKAEAEQCVKRWPEDIRSVELLIECLLELRELDQASELIERYGERLVSAKGLRLRAQWLIERGDAAGAAKLLSRSLELNAYEPATHFLLARALRLQGRADAARRHMELFKRYTEQRDALSRFCRTVRLAAPTDWTAPEPAKCVELARRCSTLGHNDLAREWLEEALSLQPGFKPATEALAELAEKGQLAPPEFEIEVKAKIR